MQVFDSLEALSTAAADAILAAARSAVADRGQFVLALSGGSTPKRLYAQLAQEPYLSQMPWDRTHLVFGDERFVPATDEQSNEHMARTAFGPDVRPLGFHGMVRSSTPEADADRYEALLRDFPVDVTLLGIGPDGHTASLFPGRPSVHVTDRDVIAAKANMGVEDRITFTVPMINRSRQIFFLVAGADKAEPMHRILHGEENWDETPTQAVARHAPSVTWFLDRAAAAELPG